MPNDPYTTPRRPLDHAAIAEHNAGIEFSRLAYEDEHGSRDGIDYRARTAASEKQQRYRARRKDKK